MKKATKMIIDYFHTLRFDPKHHLGLGDIRLTLAQQEELIELLQGSTFKQYYPTKIKKEITK
jgi:hypothetical protein